MFMPKLSWYLHVFIIRCCGSIWQTEWINICDHNESSSDWTESAEGRHQISVRVCFNLKLWFSVEAVVSDSALLSLSWIMRSLCFSFSQLLMESVLLFWNLMSFLQVFVCTAADSEVCSVVRILLHTAALTPGQEERLRDDY